MDIVGSVLIECGMLAGSVLLCIRRESSEEGGKEVSMCIGSDGTERIVPFAAFDICRWSCETVLLLFKVFIAAGETGERVRVGAWIVVMSLSMSNGSSSSGYSLSIHRNPSAISQMQ